MKFVLAPVGSEGDVRPMAALGRRLVDRGHEVVVAAAPDFAALFARHGLAYQTVGAPFLPLVQNLAGRVNGRPSGIRGMLHWCRVGAQEQFDGLGAVVRGADHLVGSGLQFAASSFAEREGIAYTHVAHVPVVLPSRSHPPVTVPWQRLPAWGNALLWRLSGLALNRMMRSEMDRHRCAIGLGKVGDFNEFFTRHFLVAIDPELGPLPADVRSGTRQTGYWRIDDDAELAPEVDAFLRAGEPPVYFGFGSMGDDNPARTSEIIAQTVRQLGCRAIVARGWAGLQAHVDGERLLEVGHVPHAKLFPRVAAVVHHGGAGTTWTASRYGVAQVVIPHLLDQYYWARRLELLGIAGSTPQRRNLTPTGLATSLRQALDPARRPFRARLSEALAARDGIAQAIELLEATCAKSGTNRLA